jgi:hypothetical protein
MADLTYNELQERVAQKLQLIADAESLNANYAALIIDGLLAVQAQLSRLGIASLDVENGIDHIYVEPVAGMTAAALVDDFQIPEPLRSQLIAAGKLGLPGRSPAERFMRDLLDGVTQKLFVSDPGITVV